jgi:hypothetical protein
MKTTQEYFEYLIKELKEKDSKICKSILERSEKFNDDYINEISKMLFFLYKVEGIRIANYKEFQRL